MKQWVIDQPAFAEELLEGLNEIDWPESTKEMQRNWIGKSTGVEVDFMIGIKAFQLVILIFIIGHNGFLKIYI